MATTGHEHETIRVSQMKTTLQAFLDRFGGGGGTATLNQPLSAINDAGLGAPTTAGSVLTWNGTAWVYGESYTKLEADGKFMTIAAFENLFRAFDSNSTKVNHPYSSGVANIKAMVGLWTEQYLSALGQNSSGGGGGETSTLAGLNDVNLGTLSNGQVLTYNSTTGEWVNSNAPQTGVTSITAGTGLTTDQTGGAAITSTGTISISSTYQTYISHGEVAYNNLSNYLPLTGGTMRGVITLGNSTVEGSSYSSAINVGLRSTNGNRASYYTSGSYIHGGEDNASQDGANVQIGTWYGFGIYPTISDQTRKQGKNSFWHNARTGNTYTWGDFYCYDGTNNNKVATEKWVKENTVDYLGDIAADFNFADMHDLGGGVYQLHTYNTQTHKPTTYGILVDFESTNGHLQLAAGVDENLYVRNYWWTGNPDGFTYPGWKTLATKEWISQNYISIAFFNRLFQAKNGSTNVNPNDTTSTIDSIKAMFGFWTDQYLSALGQNSGGGGGGGSSTLAGLNDVDLGTLSNGQVLMYNITTGKWYNGTVSGGGVTLNEPLSSINNASLGTPSGTDMAIVWSGTAWTYKQMHTTLDGLSDVLITNPSVGQVLKWDGLHWVNGTGGSSGGTVAWGDVTNKPSTIAGYGITDAKIVNGVITLGSSTITPLTSVAFSDLTSHPTTLSGYDITDAKIVNGVITLGANTITPLTSVAFSDLTSHPTTLSGYDITDAKIVNGVITLGSNTITPLTSVAFSDLTSHPTTLRGYGITDAKFGTAGADYVPITLGSTTKNVLTDHQSLSAYATQAWVTNNFLGINSTAAAALKLTTARTIWGQNFDGSANVTGSLTSVESITMSGWIHGTQCIEMNDDNSSNLKKYGGFIDFHFRDKFGNKMSYDDDYSARLIEGDNGNLDGVIRCCTKNPDTMYSFFAEVGLRIGDARLVWDSFNNALKVEKYDGTVANFYATGGVSALGVPTSGSGTVDTLNVNTLKAVNNLYIGDTNSRIYYDFDGDELIFQSGSGDISMRGSISMDGQTKNINTRGGNIYLGGGYLYLSSNVYLYTDGSNVKVSIGGQIYTLNKS